MMYIYFLKDYIKDGILIYKKDETNLIKDDTFARYLIRAGYGVKTM